MKFYAGLDVSAKETSKWIVDEAGRICREMKVVSHREDLLAVLCESGPVEGRIGRGASRCSLRRRASEACALGSSSLDHCRFSQSSTDLRAASLVMPARS